MPVVTVHQAKTQLSKLLAQVGKGEEVVIARGSEPSRGSSHSKARSFAGQVS